jgi:hypothetical protein
MYNKYVLYFLLVLSWMKLAEVELFMTSSSRVNQFMSFNILRMSPDAPYFIILLCL